MFRLISFDFFNLNTKTQYVGGRDNKEIKSEILGVFVTHFDGMCPN